jgi:hypothetical protein
MDILIVYTILLSLFIIATITDMKANKRRDEIQDEIDRITLGEKYYDQLYGRGAFEFGKHCKNRFELQMKKLDDISCDNIS